MNSTGEIFSVGVHGFKGSGLSFFVNTARRRVHTAGSRSKAAGQSLRFNYHTVHFTVWRELFRLWKVSLSEAGKDKSALVLYTLNLQPVVKHLDCMARISGLDFL